MSTTLQAAEQHGCEVALAVMPEGVEHISGNFFTAFFAFVALAVMPEGVEHR
ncbi:hypothetical protein A176_007258 [Myxococcus hansupus]|uniref:Uncharacterized protein n=1 Tax=Pseudomyxococcus hansupus TaxID=1297742 RepID=A0A0H4X3U0_9BACT|nr:hypothetical protein A176_007258 [Myxococcus hansupus]